MASLVAAQWSQLWFVLIEYLLWRRLNVCLWNSMEQIMHCGKSIFSFFVEGKSLWLISIDPKRELRNQTSKNQVMEDWQCELDFRISWCQYQYSYAWISERCGNVVLLRERIPAIQPCKKFSIEWDIFRYSQKEWKIQEYFAGFISLWDEYELANLEPIKNNWCIKSIKSYTRKGK